MSTLLSMPFLTELDSRAEVKGSRDPLGIQPIWTRFGRKVVGNLTTVTDSVRSFTTLLLGYWFAERIADEHGANSELATFLKWEQLAAYARAHVNKDFEFRGTERVRRNLAESSRIVLSDNPANQILGNQKIYGLWGLYTVSARTSGLLEGDPPRLTQKARAFIEAQYLPVLAVGGGRRDARRIRESLSRASKALDLDAGDTTMVRAVANVLGKQTSSEEREFYTLYLLHGGPQDSTAGRQKQFAELLRSTLAQTELKWSPALVENLSKTAARRGSDWETLAHYLHRIRTCESVLAPTSAAFTYLLGLNGMTLDKVSERLTDTWGNGLRTIDPIAFQELEGAIAPGDSPTGSRWVNIARVLAKGDYGQMVELLLAQNASVMTLRGGAPWVELRAGRLHVQFLDEKGTLPGQADIPKLWRFSYFLGSLRSIAAQLEQPRHD